jgi:hypothetical protein
VGLKNSDAVGLRLDLRAELLVNGTAVGSGDLNNVAAGSSGFNNAVLQTVAMSLLNGAVEVPAGAQLGLRASVRRTCFGGGHASGAVRLWFNGAPVDTGTDRDAGSRVSATLSGSVATYFLRTGAGLSTSSGAARQFVDVTVNSASACPTRPFLTLGVWTMAAQ